MKRLPTIACLLLLVLLNLSPPVSGTEKPEIDPGKLAVRIHELVNKERAKNDLPPLKWNEALAEIARKHSEDMSEKGYFSHTNPRGETPTERGAKAGFTCRKEYGLAFRTGLAENLAQNSLFHAVRYTVGPGGKTRERLWNTLEEIAGSTVQGWMKSEGHRKNILNPGYATEGIGIGFTEDGKVYITQMFC
ncbi:CAP domain-containing protein [Desulfuromonas sp. TF]|jgi:uncharacterized protein YkwD|uniref:CAP domain-containing protein n=1 Tax=Desulfuromonas sp. TF TaxID=1232410 RepID=UPI000411E820|nr:CAP domain-containing protein [Desulfuromonas sp. TF]